MGILDDAIREHLDLKRRLGAEDEEIDKLESEAFGPPSRPDDPDFADPPAAEPATSAAVDEAGAAPAAEPEAAVPDSPEPSAFGETGEEPAVETSTALFDHSLDEPEDSVAVDPAPLEPPTGTEERPALEADPEPEPPIESFDTVEHHFEGAIEETGEAEVVEGELEDEAAQPQQGTAEEDVLEETPEFLRDQPEDDELWFEQGEPKDFDF